MEKMIRIPAIKISQPIGEFFVGKMDSDKLIELCSVDYAQIQNGKYDRYQRRLNEARIPSLKEYMQYSRAAFPNGIILNARKHVVFSDNYLAIEEDENCFFIIDGQHRIEALKHYQGNTSFEVMVVIFDNISVDLQTEIFVTVNSEQRKVDPTIKYNLKGNDSVDTPEKMLRSIAILLNEEMKSPLKNRISFTDDRIGREEAKISLATFIRPLIRNVYRQEKVYEVKDILHRNNNNRAALFQIDEKRPKPLWDYYVNGDDEIIYLMLLNFFTAMRDVLQKDWEDRNSLLVKSSGYEAMVMLFFEILKRNPYDMSYRNLHDIVKPLECMTGHFELKEVGVGQSASLRLLKQFKDILFKEEIKLEDMADLLDVVED